MTRRLRNEHYISVWKPSQAIHVRKRDYDRCKSRYSVRSGTHTSRYRPSHLRFTTTTTNTKLNSKNHIKPSMSVRSRLTLRSGHTTSSTPPPRPPQSPPAAAGPFARPSMAATTRPPPSVCQPSATRSPTGPQSAQSLPHPPSHGAGSER